MYSEANPISTLKTYNEFMVLLTQDKSYDPCDGYYCNSTRMIYDAITYVFARDFSEQDKFTLINTIIDHPKFNPNYKRSSHPMISKCLKLEKSENVRRYFFNKITNHDDIDKWHYGNQQNCTPQFNFRENINYNYYASNKHGIMDIHVCICSKIPDAEKEYYLTIIIKNMNNVTVRDDDDKFSPIDYCTNKYLFETEKGRQNIINLITNHHAFHYSRKKVHPYNGEYISLLEYCILKKDDYLADKIMHKLSHL
ncbi:hypothetical protein BMW23_1077 [Bodo saltans virus]|uniref:Uncharacterized protein n=1 Tax=Bodo saltans virus TaxID=2024608 RepID=A0A2H4UW15_9VIRU|nr:hypothetical protein QJ851_gp1058 [Bodo saltans virus]ATZ81121.1 hypothetical protein BMW23_1077 [Bodo saltans virus]